MAEAGLDTLSRLLSEHLERGVIKPDDSVLVQFAGVFDEQVCREVGLTNVHFANIAPGSHSTGETSAERFDAHDMPQQSESYDHVLAHAGLHHCSRPHEALHEMYRLARKIVLFVENQDSVMMRMASRAGVVGWYELPAVVDGGYQTGGVDGTGVPNFVYRWTRREVTKTVAAFDPGYDIPVEFYSEWNVAPERLSAQALQSKFKLSDSGAERLLAFGHRALNSVASRQGNIFAATIRKDRRTLHPWMANPRAMKR